MQCIYSLGSSNKQSLKNSKCENYQKLIENGNKCGICKKIFGSRPALTSHIGTKHKEALLVLEKKKM